MKRVFVTILALVVLVVIATQVKAQSTPVDNASCSSITTPSDSVFVDDDVVFNVSMKNTGTTTWIPGLGSNRYQLMSVATRDDIKWDTKAAPGDTYMFVSHYKAPLNPQILTVEYQMGRDVNSFGQLCKKTIEVKAKPSNSICSSIKLRDGSDSAFVGDELVFSVAMKNNGSTTWLPGLGAYRYQLMSKETRDDLPPGTSVVPGSTIKFDSHYPAQSNPSNNFTVEYQMGVGDQSFGQLCKTSITIKAKPTPAPTLVDNAKCDYMTVKNSQLVGEPIQVTIAMTNTGTSTWKPGAGINGYRLMSSKTRDDLTREIAPGQTYATTSYYPAQTSPIEKLSLEYQMGIEGVKPFGEVCKNFLEIKATPTPFPGFTPPPETYTATASFRDPANGRSVTQSSLLDVTVDVQSAANDSFVCQEWYLDGNLMTGSSWVGGQSPDPTGTANCPN